MSTLATLALLMATMGGTPDGVVLNFTAKWCGPCQEMAPVVNRLQTQGYAIRKVDFDRERQLADRYGVTAVPTFVLLVRGEERQRISGPISEETLRRMAASIPEKLADAPPPASAATGGSALSKSLAKVFGPTSSSKTDAAQTPKKQSTGDSVIRANITPSEQPIYALDPMQVVARIRVTDSKGMDFGTGTVIHSEAGRTLVLTCGHLFRHFDQQGRVEVDLFTGAKYQRYEGTLVRSDLKKDIGLLSLKTPTPVPMARVATTVAHDGDHVFSVGCGGGDPPTKLQHRVTKTTGFQDDLVECSGTPVQGRSGGGLFNIHGQVIGVCVFADPSARRGLYKGLKTIHELLEQCGLSSLYRGSHPEVADVTDIAETRDSRLLPQDTAGNRSAQPEFSDEDGAFAVNTEADHEERPLDLKNSVAARSTGAAGSNQKLSMSSAAPSLPTSRDPSSRTKPSSQAVGAKPVVPGPSVASLAETLEATKGAEVVCIIRDPANPDGASRVVIIHRASERFVSDLTGELEQQVQATSLPVRNNQKPAPATEAAPLQRYRRVK